MDINIELNAGIAAFAGILIRWFLLFDARNKKYKKESKEFSFIAEIKSEIMLIVTSLISTLVSLLIAPEILEGFNKPYYYNTGIAFLAGMVSLDVTRFIFDNIPSILEFLKAKFLKKTNTEEKKDE